MFPFCKRISRGSERSIYLDTKLVSTVDIIQFQVCLILETAPINSHSPFLILPSLTQSLIYFLSPGIRLFWTFYVNGLIQHVVFCDSLFSLSIVFWKFIHVLAFIKTSSFSLSFNNVLLKWNSPTVLLRQYMDFFFKKSFLRDNLAIHVKKNFIKVRNFSPRNSTFRKLLQRNNDGCAYKFACRGVVCSAVLDKEMLGATWCSTIMDIFDKSWCGDIMDTL